MFRSPHTYYVCIFSAGELSYPLFWVFLWNVYVLYTSFLSLSINPMFHSIMFHSPYYVYSQHVSYCLVPCFECVSIESACISSLSLSIDLNIPLTVLCIFSACELLSCPMFRVCFYWKCMYFFSFSIHWPNIPLDILCTFLVGEFLSCHMFWVCVSVESAYISSLSLSTNLIFHSTCYVHSQRVSCCLIPCFECVFLLKVHVFLFFLHLLTYCSTHCIMYILSMWVVVLSHVLSVCFCWKCMYFFSFSIY